MIGVEQLSRKGAVGTDSNCAIALLRNKRFRSIHLFGFSLILMFFPDNKISIYDAL